MKTKVIYKIEVRNIFIDCLAAYFIELLVN